MKPHYTNTKNPVSFPKASTEEPKTRFDEWWDNHGKYNAKDFDKSANRLRELMKLAFEVGSETVEK